ncbi:MAG TPA: hypothetical protein IAB48_11500 [Candidatus Fimimorpha excrementavium]|nr:hypothetical protein [Candidatus Fimimorpha excrementavium]
MSGNLMIFGMTRPVLVNQASQAAGMVFAGAGPESPGWITGFAENAMGTSFPFFQL